MGVTLRTTIYARKGDEDMVFSSVNEAATYVNGKANRIYKCCEGVLRYHRGWQFSYKPLPPRDVSEKWRDIDGYRGKYQVSNKGNVRTMQNGKTKCLKLKDNFGYMCVVLYNGKTRKDAKVHRLVAEAFIPNPNNKPCVDHIDADRTNNTVANLRWVTYQENNNSPLSYKARSTAVSAARSVTVAQYNKEGELLATYPSIIIASKFTSAKANCICDCCRGRIKTAGGFIWKYINEI